MIASDGNVTETSMDYYGRIILYGTPYLLNLAGAEVWQ
jgi:hypothetical protein